MTGEYFSRGGREYYEMSPLGSNMGRWGFSFRNAVLVVFLLLIFHLGRGWARGILEGNYTIGLLGLVLALVPIVWLLAVLRKAYW